MHDDDRLDQLCREVEEELVDRILPYWMHHTLDEQYGGFIGSILDRNEVVPQASKGGILNTRILWTFSAAYRLLGRDAYLPLAQRAYGYLLAHLWDPEYQGIYWSVDYQGRPDDSSKHVYTQAFAIYSLAEYYRATGTEESLLRAIQLFRLIEEHAHDDAHRGYAETFDRTWKPVVDTRLSNPDLVAARTMNTHLHIMEAYANLLRVWPDEDLRARLREVIDLFLDHIIDPATHHLILFFDADWKPRSTTVSFGHDIEATWLLAEAAEVLGDAALRERVAGAVFPMAEAVRREGVDTDGGVLNERTNGHLDSDKHWWPQAEGVVGFLNAWQESGRAQYLDTALATWRFTQDHIVDRQFGEWFWRTNRQGEPYPGLEKVGLWKCPYHNARMCLEVLTRTRS